MTVLNKHREFIIKAKTPCVLVYEFGIPTGVAKTKGYGDPGGIEVLLVDANSFKTRNSKHICLDDSFPMIRRDYGTKKGGHCFEVRKAAHKSALKWATKLNLQNNKN